MVALIQLFPNPAKNPLEQICPSHIPKIMPIGPSAAAGEVATHGRKEGKLGNL